MTILSSLTNRIFLASALLVLASIGVAIYRVNVSVAAQAETDLRTGLADATSLVEDLSRSQFGDFVIKGQLIADLPVLKGAAATNDPPTVQPIAREYQARIGADLFVVVGRGRSTLARAGRIQIGEAAIDGILSRCGASPDGSCFWRYPDGVLHVAAIPIETDLGTLIVGAGLDREVATRIRDVTNSEIAFATGEQIVASSLDVPPAGLGALTGHDDVFSITLGDDEYVGRVQPLGSTQGLDEPVAFVLRSRTEHLRFLPGLRWQIAMAGVAAVAVATLLGYLIARTVTRPLRALTGTMRDMAATGDLARAMPALGRWDDADVRLVASTFRQLTGALDRFQREASTRERLSSLGRLSAVVAHEIRNPLMIIKSSARALRRVPVPDVAAVAVSIDEEVVRLNRVVSGVLDFARPIPFQLARADLVQICRSATGASTASPGGLAIATSFEVDAAPVVTDAERLRSVLVNVLDNAGEAVRARADAGAGAEPVALHVATKPGDRWQIRIVDTGIGIAPEHIGRIFDPFFTTRQTGSGLGLAIARNIIEGLGGTITVSSTPGVGTVITIELPGHRDGDPAS